MTLLAERVPCVWVVASHRELGNEHGQPQQYTLMDEAGTRTLVNLGLQPACFPRVPTGRLGTMLDLVDGVLLGGSPTNVHPRHFGEEPTGSGPFDETRDALALPLVRLAIERGMPLIAFCRGSHEVNVALGGSLHRSLQDLRGPVTHWEDPHESLDAQYRERHEVACVPGGALERMAGCTRFGVSSLHSQGIQRLAPGLVAEAFSDDGLVEAARWYDERQFAWAFQFHPEWGHQQNPRYRRIMGAFVDACWEQLAARAVRAAPALLPQVA